MNGSWLSNDCKKHGSNKIPRCTNTSPELVTTKEQCCKICIELRQERDIALDMEGIELGRNGEVCCLQIAVRDGRVFIFDIVALGADAFSCGLKSVLEDDCIAKLVFDCRCDADALYSKFKVLPRHILDMQVLWHHQSRDGGRFLHRMTKALKEVLPPVKFAHAEAIKEQGSNLYNPRKGGCFNIWKVRPMHDDLLSYCASDVAHLFKMMDNWGDILPRSNLRVLSEGRALTRILSPDVVQSAEKDFYLVGHQPLQWETQLVQAQYLIAAQALQDAEVADVRQVIVAWPVVTQATQVPANCEECAGRASDAPEFPERTPVQVTQRWLDDGHDCASMCASSPKCKDALYDKHFGRHFEQWMGERLCVKNTFVEFVQRGLQDRASAKRRAQSCS